MVNEKSLLHMNIKSSEACCQHLYGDNGYVALNVNYLAMFNAQVWICINFEGIGLCWQNGRAKLV